jgi:hypothetical protein
MNRKAGYILVAWAVLLAVVMALVGYWAGWRVGHRSVFVPAGKPDTVTVTKWIPAPVVEPETKPVFPKLVFLPVHDTLAVHDTTAVRDSVLVEVPIEEKTYPGENYRVTIRGFEPELVDIWIRQDEKYITRPYRRRWSFTVGPQVGVGYTPQGLQPYAGAGITFGYSF